MNFSFNYSIYLLQMWYWIKKWLKHKSALHQLQVINRETVQRLQQDGALRLKQKWTGIWKVISSELITNSAPKDFDQWSAIPGTHVDISKKNLWPFRRRFSSASIVVHHLAATFALSHDLLPVVGAKQICVPVMFFLQYHICNKYIE